jgi:hypothetical protein
VLANVAPIIKARPYLNALVAVAAAMSVMGSIPGIVWMVSDRSLAALGSTLGGILLGTLWLAPGALLQVLVIRGFRSEVTDQGVVEKAQ